MKRYKVRRRENPNICPNCGSKKLWHAGFEYMAPWLVDAVNCDDCDFTFEEIYRFTKWSPTGKFSELEG